MIILKIKANNVYNFRDFTLDFSYPKKIINSTIGDEYLEGYPNFRFKKAVILMGSSATGKTCLGRLISKIALCVNSKNGDHLKDIAKDNACVELCFLNGSPILYKLVFKITNGEFIIDLFENKIGKKDSFELAESGLKMTVSNDINAISKRIGFLECQFAYPEISNKLNISDENKSDFLKVLKCVIGTLDPTLKDVVVSKELDNSFIIKRKSDTVIIQDGILLNKELLSSGTIEGIDVALFIASMITKKQSFYYCDEHFSYIHTDIEKRIFSIMVGKLKNNEQLIFTTHNADMLDLNVPKHTFAFLKRNPDGSPFAVFADSLLKRNTDSVRSAVENDLFESTPDLSLLNELEEDYE